MEKVRHSLIKPNLSLSTNTTSQEVLGVKLHLKNANHIQGNTGNKLSQVTKIKRNETHTPRIEISLVLDISQHQPFQSPIKKTQNNRTDIKTVP